jgi:putative ABC transport system substrate-binding protein
MNDIVSPWRYTTDLRASNQEKNVFLGQTPRGETPGHAMRLALLREVAPHLGLKLNEKPAKAASDIDEALGTFSKQTTDGIFIIGSGLFREPCKKIVTISIQKKLPLWGCESEQGFLSSYRADEYHYGSRGAWYVDKILKGTKPTDLPVERPIKFKFTINLKTAKQIGLSIPQWTLMKADEVIK